MTNTDYRDDLAILSNTPAPSESLLHGLNQAARGIRLDVDANKTEYMFQSKKSHLHSKRLASKISSPVYIQQQHAID